MGDFSRHAARKGWLLRGSPAELVPGCEAVAVKRGGQVRVVTVGEVVVSTPDSLGFCFATIVDGSNRLGSWEDCKRIRLEVEARKAAK